MDKGTLIISSAGNEIQTLVQYHMIRLDDGPPLQIKKDSEVEITLDAGDHNLEIYAYSLTAFTAKDGVFGQKTYEKFHLDRDEPICYQYQSPYGIFMKGSLNRILPKGNN